MRPRFHDIRNKLAQSLLQLGDLDQAVEQLKIALEGNARFIPARLNLGLAYFRRGDRDLAVREWEGCHALEPGNPQVRAYLSMLEGHDAAPPNSSG
jgi:Flp pilus assembly protein TadD